VKRASLITNERIQNGDVIVGLSSYGKTFYEKEYNSGLGSNGLTSARHDVLSAFYAEKYPESFNPALSGNVAYIGNKKMTDSVTIENGSVMEVGKLLLSPTRTFAPLMKEILSEHASKIHGMVHCSGGGQTKCMKYLPGDFTVVKDNLHKPPAIFKLILENSGSSDKEMFEVFNMGTRMELYCAKADAPALIDLANTFGISAQVIGHVESGEKALFIHHNSNIIKYS
jgi:phosphoribosylformylglycinamidine cyclo-ligase